MKIIVGLGNPGEQYKNSRHNAGWQALDLLFGADGYKENKKFSALVKENGDYLLVKPLTFMNNSGLAVRKIMDYYGFIPKTLGLIAKRNLDLTNELMIIQDDLDINLGESKKSLDSGSAGHRGIDSIISHLKTQKFVRFRLGIKTEMLKAHIPPEKFVLDNFPAAEKDKLAETIKSLHLN